MGKGTPPAGVVAADSVGATGQGGEGDSGGVEAVVGLDGLEDRLHLPKAIQGSSLNRSKAVPAGLWAVGTSCFFFFFFFPLFVGQAKEEGEKMKRKVVILEGKCQS